MHRSLSFPVIVSAVLAGSGAPALGQSCTPGWAQDFYWSEMRGDVVSVDTFDFGNGPKLIAAGTLSRANQAAPRPPTVWTGTQFEQVGPGVQGNIYAMARFDPDGPGPAPESLIVGGSFTEAPGQPAVKGIARWDGTTFVPMGSLPTASGSTPAQVTAMTVHNDGSGPKLYVAGRFDSIGGVTVRNIAIWDGASWSALAHGIEFFGPYDAVSSLVSHTDSSGTFVYAAGTFLAPGVPQTRSIARWDGSSWQPLGTGVTETVSRLLSVNTATTGGPALIATGQFATIGGITASKVAMWKDSAWHAMATAPAPANQGAAPIVGVLGSGAGANLYGNVGGPLCRWDGVSWVPIIAGNIGVIRGVDASTGTQRLFVNGQINGEWSPGLSAFDGVALTPLVGGFGEGTAGFATLVAVGDVGQGPRLFVNGISGHKETVIDGIAMWDGATWTRLGGVLQNGNFRAMAVLDLGDGPHLYIGGYGAIGGAFKEGVLRWSGSDWVQFGPINLGGTSLPNITQLRAIDMDGSGPKLYVSGTFNSSSGGFGNVPLLRLEGGAWVGVGPAMPTSVRANDVAVFDSDGPGGANPTLYIAGAFNSSGVLKLQNGAWVTGGQAVQGIGHSLRVFDDGSGPQLYVTGQLAGDTIAVARLQGEQWSPVGTASNALPDRTNTLAVHDDGNGPALFAASSYRFQVGSTSASLMKWTGAAWEPLGLLTGGTNQAGSLASFTYQGRPALFVSSVGTAYLNGVGSRFDGIGVYVGCLPTCSADFNRDGDFGTDADIEAFFACLAGNCCATCLTSDFNGDGDFGTDGDIESFFRVLAGGAC